MTKSAKTRVAAQILLVGAVITLRAVTSPSVASSAAMRRAMVACPAASDSGLMEVVDFVKEIAASTDPTDTLFRNKLGLRGVDSSAVHVVNDSTACTRVTIGIDSATGISGTNPSASYLVLGGGRYYIGVPVAPVHKTLFVVDSSTFVFQFFMPLW